MPTSDPNSRNNISLDTGSGSDQHYDQICALSAKTINANFEALFKQRPEIKELTFNDGDHGVMKAIVNPPKIMIDPNQERAKDPEIYLQISFASGSIWYSAKTEVNIGGWVITVSANLGSMCASAASNDDSRTKNNKKKVRAELKKTFDLDGKKFVLDDPTQVKAGEYSIHRLFAALTENTWNNPLYEYSTVPGTDGKPVAFNDWAKSSNVSLDASTKVKETLKFWALKHEYSAYFTLGLQLRLPEPQDDPWKPTFVPFAVRLQGYPYISKTTYDSYVSRGRDPIGQINDPYNCLVFCETVGSRTLPNTHLLSFTGNLSMPADPASGKEVAGSFILDHRLFLLKHLLPYLQELCMGSLIVPLHPKLYGDGVCEAVFCAGSAPTDPSIVATLKFPAPPALANNPYYAFKNVGPRCYKWDQYLEAPGSGTETYAYRSSPKFPLYRHWKTYSQQSVTVSWEEGGHELIVKGNTKFYHWEAYSSKSNFPWYSCNPDEAYWGQYDIEASWSIGVDLTVATASSNATGATETLNGVVDPKVTRLDESTGLPKDFDVQLGQQQYDIGKGYEIAKAKIRDGLSERMKYFVGHLKERYRATGRFVYPGTGTLTFGRPKIAANGDVYADIDYLPPKEGMVGVRAPGTLPYDDPLYRTPDIGTVPHNPTVDSSNHPHVDSTITVEKYDPKTHRVRILVSLKNHGEDPVAFQMVKVQVLPVQDGKTVIRLFEESDSDWGHEKGDEEAVDGVWSLTKNDIAQDIELAISKDGSLDIKIKPKPSSTSNSLAPRFILGQKSSISLELEGTAPKAAVYVIQVRELWETTDLDDELDSSQWADAFLSVTLKKNSDETGAGTAKNVTFEEAEKIQGVQSS